LHEKYLKIANDPHATNAEKNAAYNDYIDSAYKESLHFDPKAPNKEITASKGGKSSRHRRRHRR
jgi:hypothetical protein